MALPLRPWPAMAAASALPDPSTAPFDHVVVLMMENRSFDHFLGWLPGADGIQEGLVFYDSSETPVLYPTYPLEPDYQGCDYDDPDHSWEGGLVQLNGGALDGFLKTAPPGDTFPIGYYTEDTVSVLGALARNYTVSDRYFCSLLGETYPNRFYMHAAATDRDHNNFNQSTLPTIWDLVLEAGLTGGYYFNDAPFLGLWYQKYASIMHSFPTFLADCAADQLPNVAFVDPRFEVTTTGSSGDDHPYGDVRNGEAFIGQVYQAVRSSPAWNRTVLVINFDEWGGFFDHVIPPLVVDTTTRPDDWGPHPDYRQLGFRVPAVVASPFSPKTVFHDNGAPFEHTSILKMIEWRWGLDPLTDRDANARNLADMRDFNLARTDLPEIPQPLPPAPLVCGVSSTPAQRPDPVATGASSAPSPSPSPAPGVAGGGLPNTPATSPVGPAAALLGAAAGAGLLATKLTEERPAT
ncbi:MAG: phospholipase [Chloroflexota bacterium]|nr:phospholipase [Chloroflexota bacterium]